MVVDQIVEGAQSEHEVTEPIHFVNTRVPRCGSGGGRPGPGQPSGEDASEQGWEAKAFVHAGGVSRVIAARARRDSQKTTGRLSPT